MKTFLTALLILSGISGFSQIAFVDFSKAKTYELAVIDADSLGEGFYNKDKYYIFLYSPKPENIKKCISKVIMILEVNEADFSKPNRDDTRLASNVEDLFDYNDLHASLMSDTSEIFKIWMLENGWIVQLKLKKETRTISLYPPY